MPVNRGFPGRSDPCGARLRLRQINAIFGISSEFTCEAENAHVQTIASPRNCSKGSLVIVVDDDAAVRHSLKFSLELEGFAVRLYAGGPELLRANGLADCACLVIDQNMPGLTGIETVCELRDRHIDVPAILITGRPNPALSASAHRASVDIIEKPLFGNALIDGIRAKITR